MGNEALDSVSKAGLDERTVQLLDAILKQGVEQTRYLAAIKRGVGICAVILILFVIFGVIGFFATVMMTAAMR